MKFRLPPSFRTSRTVRLHSFAFGLLALAGLLVTGFLQIRPIDLFYYDVYVVVAIGHLVMAAATLFGVFAIAWTIFEAFARRRPHEKLGQTHFWLTLAGIVVLLAALSPASFRWAESAATAHWIGILILGATLFTLAAQLLFPVAVIVSWSKPKLA